MQKIIIIEAELPDDDGGTFLDVLTILETTLPYICDNVLVTSRDAE